MLLTSKGGGRHLFFCRKTILVFIYFYLEMFVESNLDDPLSTPTLDGDERPRRRSRTPIRQNPEEYLVGDEDFPMERKPTGSKV